MTETQAASVLGRADRWVEQADFAWWFYDKGLVVGLTREGPEIGRLAWVVQTKGQYSSALAIGDPMDKVAKLAGPDHPVSEENGRSRIRFAGDSGTVLDIVFEGGRTTAVVLQSVAVSGRTPYPDPACLPDFLVDGVRLLMTAEQVISLLGEPPAREPMDCWESWRYPGRKLTLNLAPISGLEAPRVTWVMKARDAGPPTASHYHPPEGDTPPVPGDQVILTNEADHRLVFYYEGNLITALVLALKSDPANPADTAEEPVDPNQLAGVRLYMTMKEVQAVLGQPDSRDDAKDYCYWQYLERGLGVNFVRLRKEGPLAVVQVTQDRGAWSGVGIGEALAEAEQRLGRGVSPGTIDELQGIRFIHGDGSFFLVAADGETVVYFRLSVAEEP